MDVSVLILFFTFFVPKTQLSMLSNTKYMKIMMQIKHYQRLKQLRYVYVCISLSICGDDHQHFFNNHDSDSGSGCSQAAMAY